MSSDTPIILEIVDLFKEIIAVQDQTLERLETDDQNPRGEEDSQ